MINKLLCLTFALAVSKSASQTLTVTPECFADGETITLKCMTSNFSSPISFYLGTVNKGGCNAGSCGTTITGYNITQSGTFTDLRISAYGHSNDGGNWTCRYDSTPSDVYIVEPGSCSGNSDGKLGTWAKVGISFGCIAGAVVIFFLIVCIWMFVVGRKRNKMNGNEEAVVVCCCACCSCCVCCSSFLMGVTCHRCVKRNNTRIDPEDVEEFVYARKNTNVEFGSHIPNTTNAKWEKDGIEVGKTHKELTMFKIDGVSVNNEGLYICTIGPNELKLKYYVIVVGRTEMVYLKEDQNIELGKTIPGIEYVPAVKWMKDKNDVNPIELDRNKLNIKKPSPLDEGTYVCTFGTEGKKLTYHLIIVGRTEMVYLREHQEVELGKTIPGLKSIPNVKWMKDKEDVNPGDLVRNKLKIKKASPHDEGTYVCTLGTEERQLTYHLIIVGRTEMVYLREHQEVELGKTIPGLESIPNVKWMKDKEDVNPGDLVRNKLKIKKASPNDEGTYVCTLGTEERQLTYHLIIVGTERTINVIEGKQIEFGKDIPDSDATSDAYWTKDGKPVKSTSQKKTFYHIHEADENSYGLYVCHLGNKAELKYLLIKSE